MENRPKTKKYIYTPEDRARQYRGFYYMAENEAKRKEARTLSDMLQDLASREQATEKPDSSQALAALLRKVKS